MAQLFTFQKEPDKTITMQAIFQMEQQAWQQTQQGKEPTLKDVTREYDKLTSAQALVSYATKARGEGRISEVPADNEVLSMDESKKLGAAILEVEAVLQKKKIIHPNIAVVGDDDETYYLEPKEFSGWMQANAAQGEVIPVDEWKRENSIGLTSHGKRIDNGADESIYIEIQDGERRVVGNGKVTEPLVGYYGGVVGTKMDSDQDLLDIFLSRGAYDQMAAGETYQGPVFVMQQQRKDDAEMKVGFAESADEFKRVMTSTWKDPKEFEAKNQGPYIELTYAQYEEMKAALKDNPKLTIDEFSKTVGVKIQKFKAVEEESQEVAAPNDEMAEAMRRGASSDENAEPRLPAPPTAAKAKGGRRQPARR